jgi:G:T-mismatch repair DNA endonuclease (very short patch repair protein)
MLLLYGRKGYEYWNEYCNRQSYTNSLDYYIEKYGDSGEKKWLDYNKRKGHTLENYIKKYKDIDIAIEKLKEFYNKINNSSFWSKSSQELFWQIFSKLNEEEKKDCYFKTLNYEFCVMGGSKSYLYDFVLFNKRFCIEFNGDDWHANPKKYNINDVIPVYGNSTLAKDIWKRDEIKNNKITDKGFSLLIIWESDYKKHKETVIKRCLNEIYKQN